MANFYVSDTCQLMTYILIILDHFILTDTDVIPLSINDIFATYPVVPDCVYHYLWTFTTNDDLRIQITFKKFDLKGNGYMEIGDGLCKREETRLTRFMGNILPNTVTSLSNSTWIYIESHPRNISMIAEMRIMAANISGKLHSPKTFVTLWPS